MRTLKLLLAFAFAISICSSTVLVAQTKKGKTTKPKELIECEKKNDSLSIIVQNYVAEISALTIKIEQFKNENEKFNATASLLHVSNIKIDLITIGKGNKPEITSKAKELNKITIWFEFIENEFANQGAKNINVVITDSKGKIIGSPEKKFKNKHKNSETNYTAEGSVDYKKPIERNKIEIKQSKKLLADTYKVELYVNGSLSGLSEFILE